LFKPLPLTKLLYSNNRLDIPIKMDVMGPVIDAALIV
jgi:hypothetical protein